MNHHFNNERHRRGASKRLILLALTLALSVWTVSCAKIELPGAQNESTASSAPASSAPVSSTVRVTFPEGLSAREIAQKLEDSGVCSADGFIEALQNGDFEQSFLAEIPDTLGVYLKLEGFLYPDTYDFYLDEAPEKVAARFLNNFEKKLSADLRAEIEEKDLNLYDVITLASIIQEEAGDPAEMAMVSSVFINRLESPEFPKLQSDVTWFYYDRYIKPYIPEEEQKGYIAGYYTYERAGLPVGPITNPGMDAILSVINPDETDYYYFLTDKTGKFYYSHTFEQHQKNWDEAKAVNAALAGQSAEPETASK